MLSKVPQKSISAKGTRRIEKTLAEECRFVEYRLNMYQINAQFLAHLFSRIMSGATRQVSQNELKQINYDIIVITQRLSLRRKTQNIKY